MASVPEFKGQALGGEGNKNDWEQELESTDYLAFKCIFTPLRGEVGGAFCIIFEGATGDIVDQQLWATYPYVDKALKPDRGWRNFIKMFSRLGPYYPPVGDKLLALLPELFPIGGRIELFNEIQKGLRRQQDYFEEQVRRAFERATQCFFEVTSAAECIARSELTEAGLVRLSPEEQGDQPEETGDGHRTLVKCRPVVDPARGKAASTLMPGDIIEVGTIEDDLGAGSLVRNFLVETGQSFTFPVESVIRHEGKIYIYLRISSEIQGVMTLATDLRLKLKRTQQLHLEPASLSRIIEVLGDAFYLVVLASVVTIMMAVFWYLWG